MNQHMKPRSAPPLTAHTRFNACERSEPGENTCSTVAIHNTGNAVTIAN